MKKRQNQLVKSKSRFNWKVLIVCFVVVYAVAFIGSLFTSSAVNTEWYQSIKPAITPPNYVFPIVWNILFFLIAVSLYLAYTSSNKKQKTKVALVFLVNFILNILWSILYFGAKSPIAAFFEIILLWISIFMMLVVTYKISKKSSYLLIPYLLWVSFAAVLNYLSII